MSDSANDVTASDMAAAEPEAENSASDTAGVAEDPTPVDDSTDAPVLVEDLVSNLEAVTAERDQYLDGMRRLQAEFENYRKAVAKREADAVDRANDKIVVGLLPVLDACDGAVANGVEGIVPLRSTILESLAKLGLERLEPEGQPFDPGQHEAVMHEESALVDSPTVADVLRVGYGWKGRVIRPAMVKTIG